MRRKVGENNSSSSDCSSHCLQHNHIIVASPLLGKRWWEVICIEEHITEVESNSLFEGTDSKLAACGRPSNNKVAEECGFTSRSIHIVKELVTLSPNPLIKSPKVSNARVHLSAVELHSVQRAN